MKQVWRHTGTHAGVLLVCFFVGVVYTFPLVRHPLTTFPGSPGDTDVFGFLWNNWWIEHALFVRRSRPDLTNYIFAPFGVDLRLHTLGLLYGAITAPVFPWLGHVGVLNLQVLATPVLNGYAAFRLGAYVARDNVAGLIAAVLVAGAPAVNFHLTVGRPSCAAVWPALAAMYFLLRVFDQPSSRTTGGFTVSLAALLLVDQQIALFGLCWLAILAAGLGISRRKELSAATCIALFVAGLVNVVPLIWLYSPLFTTPGYTIPHPSEAFRYRYPVGLLWTPSLAWRVYGSIMPVCVIASFWTARRERTLLVWTLGSLAFVVLSFGPALDGGLPLPFAALQHLPGFSQFRTPYRFQIAAAMGMAVVTGVVVSRLRAGVTTPWNVAIPVLLMMCAVVDVFAYRAYYGFAVRLMPDEPVYETIAADERDSVVLEVPFGVRTGTDRLGTGELYTFYQPTHQKRLLNGFAARAPLDALAFYRSSPALMFLANETAPAGDILDDLRSKLRDLDIGYVVIHTDAIAGSRRAAIVDLVRRVEALEPLDTGRAETLAFRVLRR